MKVVKGLQGVVAAESDICKIDGKKGTLVYRGYAIEDLAKYSSFEEVVFLLWEGRLPKRSELTAFKRKIAKHMKLPAPVKRAIQSTPKKNKWLDSVNRLSQTLHPNGFSPVWVRLCEVKWLDCANRLSHTLHPNGFSPV